MRKIRQESSSDNSEENGNRIRVHLDADLRFGGKDKIQSKTWVLLATAATGVLIVLYRVLLRLLENPQ